MMKHHKKITSLLVYLVILANILNASFWFVMIYPFKVVEINSVEILTPEVRPGELVRYKVNFCKYWNVSGEAQRVLVNHFEYFLSSSTQNQKGKGCHETTVSVPVPSYVEAGDYEVHNYLKHKIFGIRTIETFYQTGIFKVI